MKLFTTLLIALLALNPLQSQGVAVHYDITLLPISKEKEYPADVHDFTRLMAQRTKDYKGQLFISDTISQYSTITDVPLGDDSSVDLATKFTLRNNDIYYTKTNEIIRVTEMLVTPLTVKHPPLYKWNLSNDDPIQIKGVTCYKAHSIHTDIQGKKQTVEALYAPSLNYPYGPVGYAGLPGLIVKLKKNNIVYTLDTVETLENNTSIKIPSKKILSQNEFQEIFKSAEDRMKGF
jgi:GLPGLI family protein